LSDESLFREVDEEVRQEQFKKLWDRYGNLIIAACLVVIVGVAGFEGWKFWQKRQAEAAGDAFYSAVTLAGTGKADEALKQFQSIGHPGYAVLGRIRQASVLAAQGSTEQGVQLYDSVAADNSADATLRDLARLRAAAVLADSASIADLETRLNPLTAAGNPWRHMARELLAAAHWRNKDYANADKIVQDILADLETPANMRQRAQMLAELLVPLMAQK
jgi:hypothetical protein